VIREGSLNFAPHHAFGYRWYRIGGLDYLLRQTDIDQKDTGAD